MSMRNAAAALAATLLLGLGATAREASAGVTIDLLFVGRNGGAITPTASVAALPGDTLTMAAVMTNDEPLTAVLFSLNYDLDGGNELDVVSGFQWDGVPVSERGIDFFKPWPSPTVHWTANEVSEFFGYALTASLSPPLPPATGAFAGGYQMGTVVWKVNAGVATDGRDIIPMILSILTPSYFGGVLVNAASVNAGSVNAVPEPGSAALLALGLLGVVLASPRRPL